MLSCHTGLSFLSCILRRLAAQGETDSPSLSRDSQQLSEPASWCVVAASFSVGKVNSSSFLQSLLPLFYCFFSFLSLFVFWQTKSCTSSHLRAKCQIRTRISRVLYWRWWYDLQRNDLCVLVVIHEMMTLKALVREAEHWRWCRRH